jgi:decaprenylphospho-beta-D-ribofuranose 2-oxidase
MKKKISNWGNYPKIEAEVKAFRFEDELISIVGNDYHGIARGAGRCYGDASLSQNVISTMQYNKVLHFDQHTGLFFCQAGLTLDKILELIVPKGWFLPVTPGTKYITVGGALASDVHGKNHHGEGTFSDHVQSFKLLMHDGTPLEVTPTSNTDLFNATAGGMGLTGIITEVCFQLKRIQTAYITQKKIKARNLDEAMDLFNEHVRYTYSMSWIDCMQSGKNVGRSLLMVGEHSKFQELSRARQQHPLQLQEKKKLNFPFYLPEFTLNKLTVKGFNLLYYHKEMKKEAIGVIPYEPFFYPLDAILNWNRMYGKSGFVQYQFVLPLEASREGLEVILKKINQQGMGSFLAVLKLFGPENQGLISFPRKGYTLALDFPVKPQLFPFLAELDRIVKDYDGRIYLSKDARMSHEMFLATYPKAADFYKVVNHYNPNGFSSIQSERLMKTL